MFTLPPDVCIYTSTRLDVYPGCLEAPGKGQTKCIFRSDFIAASASIYPINEIQMAYYQKT